MYCSVVEGGKLVRYHPAMCHVRAPPPAKGPPTACSTALGGDAPVLSQKQPRLLLTRIRADLSGEGDIT